MFWPGRKKINWPLNALGTHWKCSMIAHKYIRTNIKWQGIYIFSEFACFLSFRYGRADVMPLGKFCLNLSNCPKSPSYSDLLHYLLSNLVTQVGLNNWLNPDQVANRSQLIWIYSFQKKDKIQFSGTRVIIHEQYTRRSAVAQLLEVVRT